MIRSALASIRLVPARSGPGALATALFAVAGLALLPAAATAQTAFGDTLFSFNAGAITPTGDTVLNGMEFAGGHFWVTGFNPPYYDHRLYRIAADGSEVLSSTSLATGYHAYYDLAYDGEFLWATDRDHLAQIDPATGQLTGEQIPTDFGYYLVQAVAHDPATDHFWVIPQRNGQLQVLHEIDRDGNVLATYPNLDTDYTTSLTWDTWSPGGPFLWTFSREEIGYQSRGVMRQFSPAIGAFTGVEITLVNRSPFAQDSPRGLAMTDALVPGTPTMIAVQAGSLDALDGLDWVVVYDADLSAGAPGAQITVSPTAIQTEVHEEDTVTIPVVIGSVGELTLDWSAYVQNADPDALGDGELGDVLLSLDVAAADGDPAVVVGGLTFARDHLWLSVRFGFEDRRLLQLDLAGNLVASYPIGGIASFPWRSIASDGDFIYGTDTYTITVWSIDEAQVVDNIFGGNSADALALDPDNGHFYLGSGNGSIRVLDREGDEVRLVVTPYDIAGLAWDDRSPGGPFLWAWVDLGPDAAGSRCQAIRLDPVTGLATGVSFTGQDQGALADVPAAAAITRDAVAGKLTFLGLQADDDDPGNEAAIVGYDLDVALPPAWIDLVGATGDTVAPGLADTLLVEIHGTMADTTTAAVIRISSNDLSQPLVEIPVGVAMLEALSSVGVAAGEAAPGALARARNYPNPFNPVTTIAFEARAAGEVTLEIYDLRGRRVTSMSQRVAQPGRHEFVWHGMDAGGRPVASGAYLYTLRADEAALTGRMLLAR